MNIHVKAHTKSKPYAARKFAVCKDILADLKAEREARMQEALRQVERDIGRLVRFNVRREMA